MDTSKIIVTLKLDDCNADDYERLEEIESDITRLLRDHYSDVKSKVEIALFG